MCNSGCGCCGSKVPRGRGGSRRGPSTLGWSVKIPAVSTSGHETLTLRALGRPAVVRFAAGGSGRSVTLTPKQVKVIIAGNRSVDLGWMGTGTVFAFNQGEQKRHALRKNYGQPQAAALADIVRELSGQHRGILAESNPLDRLRRIGKALHLVQDAYSPAHIERNPGRGWCVRYIRNFGRGRAPREHGKPSDPRDTLAHGASAAAAARAVAASREYLSIVFKALWARRGRNTAAAREADREFATFLRRHLTAC